MVGIKEAGSLGCGRVTYTIESNIRLCFSIFFIFLQRFAWQLYDCSEPSILNVASTVLIFQHRIFFLLLKTKYCLALH